MLIANIFKKLIGKWGFNREITNIKQPEFSGTVIGTAIFQPIADDQLHFREEGTYTTVTGKSFAVSRELLYFFKTPTISVHGYQDKKSTGELFAFDFTTTENPQVTSTQCEHLCIQDLYKASFELLDGEALNSFGLTYDVTGPHKRYISKTVFKIS